MSVLNLIGLACKAGKLAIGERAVRKALRLSQVCLLVLAKDSSHRTKRNFVDYYNGNRNIPLVEIATRAELGYQLGREQVAVAAITDPFLAQAVVVKLGNEDGKKLRG